MIFVVCFKQKTAYEMRISDGSSDVGSSDLVKSERIEAQIIEACEQCGRTALPELAQPVKLPQLLKDWPTERVLLFADEAGGAPPAEVAATAPRSEERRVGKAGVSTGGSRLPRDHAQQNNTENE